MLYHLEFHLSVVPPLRAFLTLKVLPDAAWCQDLQTGPQLLLYGTCKYDTRLIFQHV